MNRKGPAAPAGLSTIGRLERKRPLWCSLCSLVSCSRPFLSGWREASTGATRPELPYPSPRQMMSGRTVCGGYLQVKLFNGLTQELSRAPELPLFLRTQSQLDNAIDALPVDDGGQAEIYILDVIQAVDQTTHGHDAMLIA